MMPPACSDLVDLLHCLPPREVEPAVLLGMRWATAAMYEAVYQHNQRLVDEWRVACATVASFGAGWVSGRSR